jgi:hypothetical protein
LIYHYEAERDWQATLAALAPYLIARANTRAELKFEQFVLTRQ